MTDFQNTTFNRGYHIIFLIHAGRMIQHYWFSVHRWYFTKYSVSNLAAYWKIVPKKHNVRWSHMLLIYFPAWLTISKEEVWYCSGHSNALWPAKNTMKECEMRSYIQGYIATLLLNTSTRKLVLCYLRVGRDHLLCFVLFFIFVYLQIWLCSWTKGSSSTTVRVGECSALVLATLINYSVSQPISCSQGQTISTTHISTNEHLLKCWASHTAGHSLHKDPPSTVAAWGNNSLSGLQPTVCQLHAVLPGLIFLCTAYMLRRAPVIRNRGAVGMIVLCVYSCVWWFMGFIMGKSPVVNLLPNN